MITDRFGRQRVAEAALPLLDGETVDLFRGALENALRRHYAAQGVESWRFYQEDLHGDAVVVRVMPSEHHGNAPYHERIPFSRGASGALVLGEPERVRVTRGTEPVAS